MGRLAALSIVLSVTLLSSCASVREEDLQSWSGVPVAELDKHPVFLTMSVVKTQTADGTEIRNYVNGANVSACAGGGGVRAGPQQGRFAGMVDTATYSAFSNCMQRFAACNNIFYINNGIVTRATAIGTGGARCYTNEQFRPGFTGAINIR